MFYLLTYLSFIFLVQSGQTNVSAVLNAEGLHMMEQGKIKEATERFRQASQADPENVEALNNLGVALRRQGDFSTAVLVFQSALRLRANDAQIYNNLGMSLHALDRLYAPLATFKKAVRLTPQEAALHRNLGIMLMESCEGRQSETRSRPSVGLDCAR